ncbi:UNVERIFIED_CONTAM: hypothetical protein Slati_2112000 [Sesamum latifolium]|uniref:Retrotransposon Copia-like N-terminal domain-containing protein n=1 Tax=Sesamum latifolium TaxID=2727402 RepID=A0AAW2WQV2_9LAMI
MKERLLLWEGEEPMVIGGNEARATSSILVEGFFRLFRGLEDPKCFVILLRDLEFEPNVFHFFSPPWGVLVSNLLDNTNFLSWSRSIKFALRAKLKLGFIKGKVTKPDKADEEFEQWEMADGMVISWILNSISKDIVESFLYIEQQGIFG